MRTVALPVDRLNEQIGLDGGTRHQDCVGVSSLKKRPQICNRLVAPGADRLAPHADEFAEYHAPDCWRYGWFDGDDFARGASFDVVVAVSAGAGGCGESDGVD